MTNPYRIVLQGFADERSNDSHFIRLVLLILASEFDTSPYELAFPGNPYRQTLHALRAYQGSFGYARIQESFGDKVNSR
jgi:hypothetical protein